MVEKIVELRRKHQLTWPLVREMRLAEGVRLVVVYDPDADEARVRPLRESYAGALHGIYGDDGGVDEYVKGERDTWG